MSTLLEQLREITTVVADTGDFDSITKYKPQDSTTNPSLILAASQMPGYSALVDEVLQQAKNEVGSKGSTKEIANFAFKHLAVAFGRKILGIVKGRVSTEVDARLSYDTNATIAQAREIIQMYESSGLSRERI